MFVTHQMTDTPEYNSWMAMKGRVKNKNTAYYKYYGGRGIRACKRWLESFENFYDDMGPRPQGTSLERIDNNGDYDPSNCKWASRQDQSINRRIQTNNKSGYKGVYFHKAANKWTSQIARKGYRIMHIGLFDTALEAHLARIKKLEGLE